MVPTPVTTLEALLGHITEHLLQLLGGGGGGGSAGVPAKKWFSHGQSPNRSSGKGAGPRVHARGSRAGGPWSDGPR